MHQTEVWIRLQYRGSSAFQRPAFNNPWFLTTSISDHFCLFTLRMKDSGKVFLKTFLALLLLVVLISGWFIWAYWIFLPTVCKSKCQCFLLMDSFSAIRVLKLPPLLNIQFSGALILLTDLRVFFALCCHPVSVKPAYRDVTNYNIVESRISLRTPPFPQLIFLFWPAWFFSLC